MFHGRNHLGQRVLSGVDLMIDFATLGEYGLKPFCADGSCRERTDRRSKPCRRPGWEASATTGRRTRGTGADRVGATRVESRSSSGASSRANFRAALERYAT